MAAGQTSSSTQPVHDSHNLQDSAWMIMKYLLCTIPSSEALGQLLFGTTTPFLSGSWVFTVCRQIKQTGLSLHHYSPSFLKKNLFSHPLPSFPTQSIIENLLLKQNKTLRLFWVLPLCWSLAWLHNSLLKPFCSNICRELCKVISVHCQASLRFTLALTPSVKIRQCFTAWVNPYRCPVSQAPKQL